MAVQLRLVGMWVLKKNLNKQRLDKGRKIDFHCHITFMCVYKIHMCVTKIEAMYGK